MPNSEDAEAISDSGAPVRASQKTCVVHFSRICGTVSAAGLRMGNTCPEGQIDGEERAFEHEL